MASHGVKKLVRSKSGLKIVVQNETMASPLLLVEPKWVPDGQCQECMSCNVKFDFIRRKHHCRRCGMCFCSTCCKSMITLPRMCFVDPVRQCLKCAAISEKENEFFDKHMKTLTSGAGFYLKSSLTSCQREDERETMAIFLCRLSSDHRFLIFDSTEGYFDHEPIEMTHIENMSLHVSSTDSQGNSQADGMTMGFVDARGEKQTLRLMAMDLQQRRQSMLWVAAMQKAIKLLYDGRQNKG